MSDELEDLVKEIAAKHSIAVSRDDPIMILHTINDRLMKNAAASQEKILSSFKSELEATAFQWGEDSKARAEKILNAALSASQAAMLETMQEGGKQTIEVVKREIDGIGLRLATPIKQSEKIARLNLLAAAITFFAAGVALLALLM